MMPVSISSILKLSFIVVQIVVAGTYSYLAIATHSFPEIPRSLLIFLAVFAVAVIVPDLLSFEQLSLDSVLKVCFIVVQIVLVLTYSYLALVARSLPSLPNSLLVVIGIVGVGAIAPKFTKMVAASVESVSEFRARAKQQDRDIQSPDVRPAIDASTISPSLWRRNVVAFLVMALSLLAASLYQRSFWTTTVLWAGACLGVGSLVGFLFGIPRTSTNRQESTQTVSDSQANSLADIQSANNNMELIADWLTKGIVVLLLVNARIIPQQLTAAAAFIAKGMNGARDEPFALALILYFVTAGFLLGYVLTRAYEQIASSRLLTESITAAGRGLELNLARRIDAAFAGPLLSNYTGYLCASVSIHNERLIVSEDSDRFVRVSSHDHIAIQCWIQSDTPDLKFSFAERFSIKDGEDTNEVRFDIELEADAVGLHARKGTLQAKPGSASNFFTAEAITPDRGLTNQEGGSVVWVQLFQANKLIQTVPVTIRVDRSTWAVA
jgi:hypothetical protein